MGRKVCLLADYKYRWQFLHHELVAGVSNAQRFPLCFKERPIFIVERPLRLQKDHFFAELKEVNDFSE